MGHAEAPLGKLIVITAKGVLNDAEREIIRQSKLGANGIFCRHTDKQLATKARELTD
jgi:hypothetical protein